MSACTRFETEGLLQIERGESLDPHFDTCADCREARAQYRTLTRAIGRTDQELEPSPDWQQRVMNEIEKTGNTQRGTSRWWMGGAALAASAVVAALLLNPGQAPTGSLSYRLVDSDVVFRGTSAKPGDQLRLASTVQHARHAELRLYREDTLVFACTNQPPCHRDREGITADATLDAFGEYQSVLVISNQSIPAATGALDGDVLAAREAGGQVVLGEKIDVR